MERTYDCTLTILILRDDCMLCQTMCNQQVSMAMRVIRVSRHEEQDHDKKRPCTGSSTATRHSSPLCISNIAGTHPDQIQAKDACMRASLQRHQMQRDDVVTNVNARIVNRISLSMTRFADIEK